MFKEIAFKLFHPRVPSYLDDILIANYLIIEEKKDKVYIYIYVN